MKNKLKFKTMMDYNIKKSGRLVNSDQKRPKGSNTTSKRVSQILPSSNRPDSVISKETLPLLTPQAEPMNLKIKRPPKAALNLKVASTP